MTEPRFITLAEFVERGDFGRQGINHLRRIAQEQSRPIEARPPKKGETRRRRFSRECLESYPHFVKGPGGHWGMWSDDLDRWKASQRPTHLSDWRETIRRVV